MNREVWGIFCGSVRYVSNCDEHPQTTKLQAIYMQNRSSWSTKCGNKIYTVMTGFITIWILSCTVYKYVRGPDLSSLPYLKRSHMNLWSMAVRASVLWHVSVHFKSFAAETLALWSCSLGCLVGEGVFWKKWVDVKLLEQINHRTMTMRHAVSRTCSTICSSCWIYDKPKTKELVKIWNLLELRTRVLRDEYLDDHISQRSSDTLTQMLHSMLIERRPLNLCFRW